MSDKDEDKDDIIIVDDQENDKIDTGDIDSSKEGDADKVVQKKTPVRKRGNDAHKRLNEIWLGKKEAEEEANRQAHIAAQERAKNAQYEQITASALEENLNTKRDLLRERLVRAQENSDPNKIAEIQIELGRVEAQSAQIERYKIENRVQPQNQQEQPRKQQSQETQVSPDEMYERMSPAGKKWLDENSDWYDSTGDNHDSEKSGDVKYYAQTLEQELIGSGRAAEIGTRAYFNRINDYIKQNWDDAQDDSGDEDNTPPIQQKKNYAAPVGNRALQGNQNPARKEYKITQAEKELALSLDSKDTKGKPLSDNDKIRRFIGLRDSTPSSGPISMRTIHKGA